MDFLKANIMPILAVFVIFGGGVAYYYAPDNKATAIMSAITLVLGFYFGSSSGSRDKDATLKGQLECKEGEK